MDKAEYVFYKLAQSGPKFNTPYYHMVLKDKVLPSDAQEFVPGMPLANKKIHVGDNIYADMSMASDKNLNRYDFNKGIDVVKMLGDINAPMKYSDPKDSLVGIDSRSNAYSTGKLWSLSDIRNDRREAYIQKLQELGLSIGTPIKIDSPEYNALKPYIRGLP